MRYAISLLPAAALLLAMSGCASFKRPGGLPVPDQAAVLRVCTEPVLHEIRGESAAITVRFFVEPDGMVQRTTVHMVSAMDPGVSQAAIDRVRTFAASCLYEPALLDGEPIRSQVQRTISLR
jgi:hypothetical protein